MLSKTKVNQRMRKKTSPSLVKTIFLAKKNDNLELAQKLGVSTSNRLIVNLTDLNEIKEDKILICGKVLGTGEINKKISIISLAYSKQAIDKLKKAGCEVKTLLEELEKNPKLTGYKII
ncbi:50S ribosomal protein L18e [Candidatus Pacearchaeota archaeon]|nr:50S ribosomal protein L18e [Candidatus Pacearchaeota archaeon]